MRLTRRIYALALCIALATTHGLAQTAPDGSSSQPSRPLAKTYRLVYTLTEMDAGKRIGTQHVAVVLISGGRTSIKQGSKVPVVTGTFNSGNTGTQQQFTYLDVGLNIDSSLEESTDGVHLRSKVEQSSIAESSIGPQDPVVRQTVLEGTSILTLGKPLVLGSLDIVGSTRHLDIEVVLEPVR